MRQRKSFSRPMNLVQSKGLTAMNGKRAVWCICGAWVKYVFGIDGKNMRYQVFLLDGTSTLKMSNMKADCATFESAEHEKRMFEQLHPNEKYDIIINPNIS